MRNSQINQESVLVLFESSVGRKIAWRSISSWIGRWIMRSTASLQAGSSHRHHVALPRDAGFGSVGM